MKEVFLGGFQALGMCSKIGVKSLEGGISSQKLLAAAPKAILGYWDLSKILF